MSLNSEPAYAPSPLLSVVEIYGPVIQGEGVNIGRATSFIRLGGCDYRCTWCDSMYAVDVKHKSEWTKLTARDIVATLAVVTSTPSQWVSLSGGNPALQPCAELVRLLHADGRRVSVETQGTFFPAWLRDVDLVTLSPKPPSSGMPAPDIVQLARILANCLQVEFKFVIADRADYEFAVNTINALNGASQASLQICTPQAKMNVGNMRSDVLALWDQVSSWAMADRINVRVLPQLHALAYGYERGK